MYVLQYTIYSYLPETLEASGTPEDAYTYRIECDSLEEMAKEYINICSDRAINLRINSNHFVEGARSEIELVDYLHPEESHYEEMYVEVVNRWEDFLSNIEVMQKFNELVDTLLTQNDVAMHPKVPERTHTPFIPYLIYSRD